MGFSGYLGVACAILLALLVGSGALLKNAYETIGAYELAQEKNKAELQEAVDKIEEIKALRREDQARILSLSHSQNILTDELARANLRYDRWRSTLDARTLEKPEVTRRAARKAIRIRQCEIWRDTGGTGDCPR